MTIVNSSSYEIADVSVLVKDERRATISLIKRVGTVQPGEMKSVRVFPENEVEGLFLQFDTTSQTLERYVPCYVTNDLSRIDVRVTVKYDLTVDSAEDY